MRIQEVIRTKRAGLAHSREHMEALLDGYLRDEVEDYHVSAWLMAVFLNGLNQQETTTLTELMWRSGKSLPRTDKDAFWVDKHSTGGIGDKTSMILVPLVSAVCERLFGKGAVCIPMMSGRGLGHTGGTLDKLESVPGFRVGLSLEEALTTLEKNGFVMMGQTPEIAPGDRKLYKLRDSSETVESIPLIVSSILSKKLSESLNGLVLDLKFGNGAFMVDPKDSDHLGETAVRVASELGLDALAVKTFMGEPLGRMVGHLNEMEECWRFIQGEAREDSLSEVTLALAAQMVHVASRRKLSLEEARQECLKELELDAVKTRFVQMLETQDGQFSEFEKHCGKYRSEMQVTEVVAPRGGYLKTLLCRPIGELMISLGGGRVRMSDKIDPWVGVEVLKKIGDDVAEGEPLLRVFHRNPSEREEIARWNHFEVSETQPERSRWVEGIIQ